VACLLVSVTVVPCIRRSEQGIRLACLLELEQGPDCCLEGYLLGRFCEA